jgi:aurora kinase A-interacting protein
LLSISLRNFSISSNSSNSILPASSHQINSNFNPLFAPRTSNLVKDIEIGGPLWRKKEILDLPLTNKIVENPLQITKIIEENQIEKDLNLPTSRNQSEKQAKHGIIQIRKRKMRKHKRRKLWKKMRYVWAKVRQRKELKKEKRFQSEEYAKMAEARAFSAEEYVNNKLHLAKVPPLDRRWKGKRLPAFIILELRAEEEAKKLKKKYEKWDEMGKKAGLF